MFGELFTQSSMMITRRRLISRFESGKIRSVRRVTQKKLASQAYAFAHQSLS
jgi:hypothetical protein